MAVREFVDSRGVKWRVWNTRPSRGEMLSGEYGHGWLTFESDTSTRRCTPIPPDWETAPPEQLERMCRDAPATRLPSTSRGDVAAEDRRSGDERRAGQDAGR